MQQSKVSKLRLNTNRHLAGRPEPKKNIDEPAFKWMSHVSSTLEESLEDLARGMVSRPPPLSPSRNPRASNVASTHEVTPGPSEPVISVSSLSSGFERQAHAENLPNPVGIDSKEDSDSESSSDTDSSSSSDSDCDDEEAIVEKADKNPDVMGGGFRVYLENFPKVEKNLKARIQRRMKLNQGIGARMADIERCKKYAITLKKLEGEFYAARTEGRRLQDSLEKAAESARDSACGEKWSVLLDKWGDDDRVLGP